MIRHQTRSALLLGAALVAAGPAGAQVVVNGTFETGDLTGWTTGGTNAAGAVRASHFTGGTPTVVEGTYFGLLTTGPDNRGGAAQRYDANTTDDFDFVSLSQTVNVPFAPAVIAFDWKFPSSEQDQTSTFDDLFDLRTTIGATTTQIWSGSSYKADGSNYSNFPSTAATGLAQANWTLNATSPTAVRNTVLRFGVGATWNHACIVIPGLTAANTPVTLRFAALDQGDNGFDSALMLDKIEIRQACDTTPTEALVQVTNSTGANVEVKNGGVHYTPIANQRLATDATGTNFAFVSNGNYTGDNPNAIEQVFIWNGSAYQRVTGLTTTTDGDVQNVAMSSPLASSIKGRYLAISAKPNAAGFSQIYRWDRSTSTLSQVTANAAACVNENPSISDDGTRIAWESTCSAITGAGSTRKIVYSTISGSTWGAAQKPLGTSTTCNARNGRLQRDAAAGRYMVLESDCDPLGTNTGAANNYEIFRYDITGAAWRQITSTSPTRTCTGAGTSPEGVINTSPMLDGQTASLGRYTFFLSNADLVAGSNSPCDSLQIFRYDANGSGSFTQLTTASQTLQYLGVYPAADGDNYAFERFNASTAFSELGRRQRSVAATDVIVFQGVLFATNAVLGYDGTVPIVSFYTQDDPLDTNTDNNTEIFSARGP